MDKKNKPHWTIEYLDLYEQASGNADSEVTNLMLFCDEHREAIHEILTTHMGDAEVISAFKESNRRLYNQLDSCPIVRLGETLEAFTHRFSAWHREMRELLATQEYLK